MAKQAGPFILERTIDNLIFYKMDGIGYLRMKPDLTRKQMLNSKRFVRTMQSAGRLRRGSQIAAKIYAGVPEGWKDFCMYRIMVGEAISLVKTGKTDEEAYKILWERYLAEFEQGYNEAEAFVYADMAKPEKEVEHVLQAYVPERHLLRKAELSVPFIVKKRRGPVPMKRRCA